jgi:hypothetical protein
VPSRSTGTTTDGGPVRRSWSESDLSVSGARPFRTGTAFRAGQTGFVRTGHSGSDRVWTHLDARLDGSYTLSVSGASRPGGGH